MGVRIFEKKEEMQFFLQKIVRESPVYVFVPLSLLRAQQISPAAKLVYAFLLFLSHKGQNALQLTTGILADAMQMSVPGIRNALRQLQAEGYILFSSRRHGFLRIYVCDVEHAHILQMLREQKPLYNEDIARMFVKGKGEKKEELRRGLSRYLEEQLAIHISWSLYFSQAKESVYISSSELLRTLNRLREKEREVPDPFLLLGIAVWLFLQYIAQEQDVPPEIHNFVRKQVLAHEEEILLEYVAEKEWWHVLYAHAKTKGYTRLQQELEQIFLSETEKATQGDARARERFLHFVPASWKEEYYPKRERKKQEQQEESEEENEKISLSLEEKIDAEIDAEIRALLQNSPLSKENISFSETDTP